MNQGEILQNITGLELIHYTRERKFRGKWVAVLKDESTGDTRYFVYHGDFCKTDSEEDTIKYCQTLSPLWIIPNRKIMKYEEYDRFFRYLKNM